MATARDGFSGWYDAGADSALSVATPALFGARAVDLTLAAPERTTDDPTAAGAGALKMAGFPPQPERFVGRVGVMARASAALAARSGIPGVLLRSVYASPDGTLVPGAPTYITDQNRPLAERWGGWYVSGKAGDPGVTMANGAAPHVPVSPYLEGDPRATDKEASAGNPQAAGAILGQR